METRKGLFLLFAMLLFIAASCGESGGDGDDNDGGGGGDGNAEISLVRVFEDVPLDLPVDFENAGDGTGRIFVVEQRGTVRVIRPGGGSGTFLDLRDKVFHSGESGLLGIAFHPGYGNNGHFYVYYVADGPRRSVVSRFSVSGDPDDADPGSEVVILEIPQPQATNHKAGQLAFGPDGYLYIATGDGGGAGSTSRDRTNLLGSILRIDVDNPDEGLDYGIPDDNPFAGNTQGWREEIYAYGFRNPWRFAFDPLTEALFAGDVGDSSREEIDLVEPGGDYGWDVMEGSLCHNPPTGCDTGGKELPIFEYGPETGRAIIAGLFYRGGDLPGLFGKFVYGDYVSGRVWALEWNGAAVTDNEEVTRFGPSSVTTFGTDEDGEAYVCLIDGSVYRFAPGED
ncbi:MAG TPA: PQQ-dependent sugar dehydrogenase [Thermodesulfobacteriota bacterium]|nr:PQQ-dependent sugar dehydrogenase [Thermodesulfobacteriota bacterium]